MRTSALILLAVGVAVLAAVAVRGEPSSGTCSWTNACSDDASDCPGSEVCCDNVCMNDYPQRDIGEVCDGACQGVCKWGSCVGGRCQRPAESGVDCQCSGGACGNPSGVPQLRCDFDGLRAPELNTCVHQSLPAGAACPSGENWQCSSGTCTNNVCEGLAAGSGCSMGQFQCTGPNVCVWDITLVSRQCGSRREATFACRAHSDCSSGVCNDGECVDAFSLPLGANCTDNWACESHECLATEDGFSQCSELAGRVGPGGACPGGDANCAPGLKCVGSKEKVCANVVGLDCNPGSDPCGSNAMCLCNGVDHSCTAVADSNNDCDAEALLYRKLWQLSGTVSKPPMTYDYRHYPAAARDAAAAYLCCLNTKGGSSVSEADYLSNDLQMFTSHTLDCTVDPPTLTYKSLTEMPQRCSTLDVIPRDDLALGVSSATVSSIIRPSSASLSSPLSAFLSLCLAAAIAALALAA